MSIRKAFENVDRPRPPPTIVNVRSAKGIINEHDVYLGLTHWPTGTADDCNWQVSVHIWTRKADGGLGEHIGHDYRNFKTQGEAEERFNTLLLEGGLKEEPPQVGGPGA